MWLTSHAVIFILSSLLLPCAAYCSFILPYVLPAPLCPDLLFYDRIDPLFPVPECGASDPFDLTRLDRPMALFPAAFTTNTAGPAGSAVPSGDAPCLSFCLCRFFFFFFFFLPGLVDGDLLLQSREGEAANADDRNEETGNQCVHDADHENRTCRLGGRRGGGDIAACREQGTGQVGTERTAELRRKARENAGRALRPASRCRCRCP